MDDSLKKIRRIFDDALDLAPEDRVRFVELACEGDPESREKILSLLSKEESAGEFLETPVWRTLFNPSDQSREGTEDLATEANLPFEKLGEFRLIRRLGGGGMGDVFLALQEPMNRKVALKVIRTDRRGSIEVETRFWREVEAISKLVHPNIVTVFGSGEDRQTRYFAMEYLPGQDLDERIREFIARKEKLHFRKAVTWVKDIARALASAHESGIIHRDIKPSNIRITSEGKAKLMDFGVARLLKLTTLTITGEFRGTPHYASPEQIRKQIQTVDARTDIYSLGATLYEAVTGRLPFDGDTADQVFHQILQTEPVAPCLMNPSLPKDVETIILKAMEKEPGNRYATMTEMADDLGRFLKGEPIIARPAGPLDRIWKWAKRNPGTSASLSVSLTAILIFLAISLFWYLPGLRHALGDAKQANQIATERYEQLRLHYDLRLLNDLIAEAENFLPALPELVPEMEAWLDEANQLIDRLDIHKEGLGELRKKAVFRNNAWAFNDEEMQWHHDKLVELISNLEKFLHDEKSAYPIVQQLFDFARTVEKRSIKDAREAWETAITSISDKTICPMYNGLVLEPILGLIPLGRDHESGLWEFAHLRTGSIPKRTHKGKLGLIEETGLIFVLIPGGFFQMGAEKPSDERPVGSPNVFIDALALEGPVHEVSIRPFLLSKYEMTQGQWLRITGEEPSHYHAGRIIGPTPIDYLHPVGMLSWTACKTVLGHLNLRLPTEAEWEYAARAGTSTSWFSGASKESLQGYANVADQALVMAEDDIGSPYNLNGESWDDGFPVHGPVGSLLPNAFGLHDMIGNVWEWCEDHINKNYTNTPTDGSAAIFDKIISRVYRGGGCFHLANNCRAETRFGYDPDNVSSGLGVRPALSIN